MIPVCHATYVARPMRAIKPKPSGAALCPHDDQLGRPTIEAACRTKSTGISVALSPITSLINSRRTAIFGSYLRKSGVTLAPQSQIKMDQGEADTLAGVAVGCRKTHEEDGGLGGD